MLDNIFNSPKSKSSGSLEAPNIRVLRHLDLTTLLFGNRAGKCFSQYNAE